MQIWSNRGRKTCRNRDDFIPTLHTPLSQKWRSQCHKRQQICRRPGIDKRTKTHTNIIRKFLFKLFCISAGSQPEFQRTIYQIYHLIRIVHTRCIRDPVSFFIRFFLIVIFFAVFLCHLQNLFSRLLFCHFFKHVFCSFFIFVSFLFLPVKLEFFLIVREGLIQLIRFTKPLVSLRIIPLPDRQ